MCIYITFGVRREVEGLLHSQAQTETWHKLLKEGLQQRLIVKSRHKYTLDRDYKKLFYNLHTFSVKLSDVERNLIALSFQVGIEIDTDDPRIIRVSNEIKSSPHLRKYVIKLFSRNFHSEGA